MRPASFPWGMSSRALSYSEISMAMTCQARHAFAYTGHLTDGQTLKRRSIAPILSQGRAWGASVAAWHAFSDDPSLLGYWNPIQAKLAAHEALRASYAQDLLEQEELGVFLPAEQVAEQADDLGEILDHYMATATRLDGLTRLEGELNEPIPSRTGKRGSSRYRFQGYIDGFRRDHEDHEWIVEFKLRAGLTPLELLQLSRQIRWYAWARQRETGVPVVGCVVDERLNVAPKPPRLVIKSRKKGETTYGPSHAKDQITTPELYISVCEEFGDEPKPETLDALKRRVWQQRQPILFRPGELEEAGRELVSAAKLVRDLDLGHLYPVRNAQLQLCRGCRFREACANPGDRLYLDVIFERTEPKRLRPPREEPVTA